MSSPEVMPTLRLVPVGQVRFHEHPEQRRTERLMARIRADALLRNPPVVAAMEDGAYLLLDGANRVSAFAGLGYSHVPVQVVDYGDEKIQLKGWHHLLMNGRALGLREVYGALEGARLEPVPSGRLAGLLASREAYAVWVDETTACWAILPGGAGGEIAIRERIAQLERIVAAYEGQSKLERVKLADFSQLPAVIGSVEHQLCLFPVLSKPELLHLAGEGVMIPTGLTRHLIPGRALGINLDLAFLGQETSPEEKVGHFDRYVSTLEMEGRIRFYEESVFVLNE